MKKIFLLTIINIFSTTLLQSQSISINTDGSAANTSAMLDVKSTSKGMLVPRMTSAQRTAISSAATGLLVFDNTTESFWFYTSSGWTELGAGDSQWKLDGAGNISNNNSGSVTVGTGITTGKFNVNTSSGNAIANFNGATNTSFMAFYENNTYRGYLGSYAGAANDIDFGTGGGNSTGKIHFTFEGSPAATLDHTGLGIGTTTPSEKLHISSGNILLSNSNLGIRLNGVDRPLITRGWDPFTSGNYSGIGRWGMFMEPHRLAFGIPNMAGQGFEFAKYNTNSTRTTVASVDIDGAIKRPAQGNVDLLPFCIGSIGFGGNILGGTGNFSVLKLDEGGVTLVYDITMTGVTYDRARYAVIVTPYFEQTNNDVYPHVLNSAGKIRIKFFNHDGDVVTNAFSFIVFKLF